PAQTDRGRARNAAILVRGGSLSVPNARQRIRVYRDAAGPGPGVGRRPGRRNQMNDMAKAASRNAGWCCRPCCVCGSTDYNVSQRWPKAVPQWPGIYFCMCSRCGLACFQPQPFESMWDEIYGEEYYTNGYLALRKVYRPLIRNVLRKKLSSYCRP